MITSLFKPFGLYSFVRELLLPNLYTLFDKMSSKKKPRFNGEDLSIFLKPDFSYTFQRLGDAFLAKHPLDY